LFTLVFGLAPFERASISDNNFSIFVRGSKEEFFNSFEKATEAVVSKDLKNLICGCLAYQGADRLNLAQI